MNSRRANGPGQRNGEVERGGVTESWALWLDENPHRSNEAEAAAEGPGGTANLAVLGGDPPPSFGTADLRID